MPPYMPGDRVQVLVTLIGGERQWVDAAVIHCHQPKHARRFALTVCLGMTNNDAVLSNRIYCNADGTGEEVRAVSDRCKEIWESMKLDGNYRNEY